VRKRASFDAIAPHYRWLESLTAGSLLQRCRTAFLHEIRNARNILLLGEGRGRFLREVLRQNPEARITCVDASARMLELARLDARASTAARSPGTVGPDSALDDEWRGRSVEEPDADGNRVRYICEDVLGKWQDDEAAPYDAVASHFFLDCFPPDSLAGIGETVSAATAPGAIWLIADFCLPERGWRRIRAGWILWGLYRFFRVATGLPATRLTPPDANVRAAGFELQNRCHYNFGLLHSDLWVKKARLQV
jgi:SAM-dependent methyltransferase